MAKKSKDKNVTPEVTAIVHEHPITYTLTENYMPYAMSVIVSRALPEIDGFKPSHRKLLYTMYKMGLRTGSRTKSTNVVGTTMKLNPHGEGAIYETLVRLSKGNEALLHPFVDSKGNFGKVYSRDMQYAASRYTEVKLMDLAGELFEDIDYDTVDFIDNYDSTTKEPTLLPVRFPNILVNPNLGIAVGMASTICSFNLGEVCDTTIAYLKNENCRLEDTLKAPDFSTGASLIFNQDEISNIYETGRGSFKVRSKYTYDEKQNCIDIFEIPYSTTAEAIIDKIVDNARAGKLKEITAARDETDLGGLKITIDIKRGTDVDKLMQRLYKMTPLEDSFSCNFNILIGGSFRVMGVREILSEWSAFRIECIRRKLFYEIKTKESKLHLLKGLEKILLDIDKAVKIVRETDEEAEVVPNLMIAFRIDQIQADYVADIRLRHLNREYILNRTREIQALLDDIVNLQDILGDNSKVKTMIIKELQEIKKKYGMPRKTEIIYSDEIEVYDEQEHIEDYPVLYFLTKESYFKKITPLSYRMGNEHKFKTDDSIAVTYEGNNKSDILFFTNKAQVYKCKGYEFEDTKASLIGDFLPSKLKMDEDERVISFVITNDYSEKLVMFFSDGRGVKILLDTYSTKQNRRKLVSAFYGKAPLLNCFLAYEDKEYILHSSIDRYLIVNSALIPLKTTRTSQGVICMVLKRNQVVVSSEEYPANFYANERLYRARNLPATGSILKAEDSGEVQLEI